ncbi:hypothetical protein [Conexibacter woesei]|uniref:Uncharacterized protein n=1 Tax=Conexibacter woesei (strain DSM 14684 / CCUG 47730 / CIP 108061 / JCM 11494 / NBRC 100937 / ID131577) TaxID=469383 RepID=D3FBL2_CONWI|nr:hypothetical protein [Conexibacter woesei]ADB49381.1 hypothetical protein Cwoe_0948 [Conexibacter woesei DSM 14684]
MTRASGANAAAIQAAVDGFRAQLGTLNPNTPGSAPSGRREINWDGVPDGSASPSNLPFNFFNANSPRGVLFTASDGSNATTQVSQSDALTRPRFGNLEPTYPALFQTFSPERLFTTVSRPLDIVFRVPSSPIAATTNGFGAVFTGVGTANSTFLQFFDQNGRDLGSFFAPANGLSFVGVRFDQGERVALVRIRPGDAALAPGVLDRPGVDVVAMDDFIYGEPQPLPPSGESFESGLGGFTPSAAVSLPGDPTWSAVQTDQHSGSNAAFVSGPTHVTDMTLTSSPVAIRGGGPSSLTFFQRTATENTFDGGVVEISTDNGASWTRAEPAQYTENPPTARVSRSFRNPLLDPAADRFIFTGISTGWQRTALDLTPFAGRTILYRFRFGSDNSNPSRGWWVDDVSVSTPPPPPPPPTPPTPTPPVTPGPVSPRPAALRLTALSVSPSAFAAGRRGVSIRYTLTAAGTVRFTVTRDVRGRRARGRCRPSARRGRSCVIRTVVGSFGASGRAGANTLAFPARVGGRRLAAGSYTLSATAGTTSSTTFRVTRARRARRARGRRTRR